MAFQFPSSANLATGLDFANAIEKRIELLGDLRILGLVRNDEYIVHTRISIYISTYVHSHKYLHTWIAS